MDKNVFGKEHKEAIRKFERENGTDQGCERAQTILCRRSRRNCPLLARLGGGKGSPELPKSIRYAMSRVIRSGKETWLVRFLNEAVG